MKQFKLLLSVLIMAFAFSFNASAQEMTPEFQEEGIAKAEKAYSNMVAKINDLERAEDAMQLERIFNSIEFRNVKKKYGKIELNDESRARLIKANVEVANALMQYIDRAQLPYQVRELLEQQVSPEKIAEEINKANTLRETME